MPVAKTDGERVRVRRPQRLLERRALGPAEQKRVDAMEKSRPAANVGAKTVAATGPHAALVRRGDFSGYVDTPKGALFVTVRLGKDAGNARPLVYLDGLAARRSRSDMMADKIRDEGGRTAISVLLPGQGETLLRDVEKRGGHSLDDDLKDTDQAQAVIDALDALGVRAPVDIFGLSYGGAIAAATKRDHPDRIANALLAAPHVESEARSELGPVGWAMLHNPWNAMGMAMYRSAAKAQLSKAFGTPELFKEHPGAFADALFRLSMGIDENELYRTVHGVEGLHILAVPGDGASPPKLNEKAVAAAKGATLTMAPDAFKGKHDIVSASPELVVMWITTMLNPERVPEVTRIQTKVLAAKLAAMKAAEAAAPKGVDP